MLLQHLEREREVALHAIADLVAIEKDRAAAVASGGLKVIADIWALLHPPERQKPEPDEPFVDPAEIRKREVKP